MESRFSSRYRILPQTRADMPRHLCPPIQHSPVGGRAANHKSYAYAVGTSLPMDCQVVKRMEMKSAYPDLTVLKIGEPFYRPLLQGCPDVPKYPELPFPHSPKERAVFKSLSDSSSDPRRRAEAPVVTYSALSSSKELPSTHY